MTTPKPASPPAGQRIDQWLWMARVTKTRTLATRLVASGSVRVNGARVVKPGRTVVAGDVITLVKRGIVRVLQIERLGQRRGPYCEAQMLYTDLSPKPAPGGDRPVSAPKQAVRDQGAGRPTKKERRAMSAWLWRGP